MSKDDPAIDTDFPGGNIIVERIDGDTVYLRQDQRGSTQRWFYWHFRVKGAGGRTLKFAFTEWDVIGSRGPCISTDGATTYRWLGRGCVEGQSFTYTFAKHENETYFSFCLPYTQRHLDAFLGTRNGIRRDTLCLSRKGRPVERLHLGRGSRKIVLTCRHHACETSASYVLEGVMEAALGNRFLREQCEIAVIPFVDKDGVEDGDQGKARNGRDHNRDYDKTSLYAETAAIRRWLPGWAGEDLVVGLDLHSPWRSGGMNEVEYQVGSSQPRIWAEQQRFGRIWQGLVRGELAYRQSDDLPFGKDWNVASNFDGVSFTRWLADLPGVKLAGSIETPYANVGAATTTPKNLRALGGELATAIEQYIRETVDA